MPETYSGLLNFATWISVIFISFLYNYWADFYFKVPTMVCGLFMVAGNFVYFLSYDSGYFFLAIVGRVLIGFGGSRIINRRYITRFVNKSVQSTWKNFYVAGSIVGRGVGPILASSLYYIDFPTSKINGVNAPALLMCLLWALYTFLVMFGFEEPVIPLNSASFSKKTEKDFSVFAVILVMSTFMIPKIVHEAQITSIPIVASGEFEWSLDFIGVFIAAMSLAVGPVYIFIGFTSDIFEDRQFTRFAMILTFIGSVMLVCYDEMYEAQYIVGTFILYLGVNLDDGIAGSLLSLIFPSSETFEYINPGFLITVFGSLARGLGAISITVAGELEDDADDLQSMIFVPLASLCGFALLAVLVFYAWLRKTNKVM
jgi:MFS family permease